MLTSFLLTTFLTFASASPLQQLTPPSYKISLNARSSCSSNATSNSNLVGATANVNMTNRQFSYTVKVGVGNPPTYYNLILDSGSSNTFLTKPYTPTSTSVNTTRKVSVTYGSGYFQGYEYHDTVTLGDDGIQLKNQSIAVATKFAGFADDVDGILGIGTPELTRGSFVDNPDEIITPVLQTAINEKQLDKAVMGIYMKDTFQDSDENGEITFGAVDSKRYTGQIQWTKLATQGTHAKYWGVDVNHFTMNGKQVGDKLATIVDSGTTLTSVSGEIFEKYIDAIPGAEFNASTGLVQLPPSSKSSIPEMKFNMGGKPYTLSVEAQLVAKETYELQGLRDDLLYTWIGSTGNMGTLDMILGMKVFMQEYYTVLDYDRKRVGFATAKKD